MSVLTESKKRQYIAEGNKSKWFRNLSEERKSEIVEKYMSSEFLDLKCDWAFKFVMSSPEILIILLNDFLPETVTEVVSVSTEPKRLGGSEKNVLMDVVARTADGREIVIEMQQFKKTDFKARMFYYGAAMVRSQLRRGKNYSKLKPVYVISFMNFRLRHSSNRLVYRYKMMEEEIHEIYGDWLSIYLCELPRLKKRAMSEMDYVEGWLHILRESVNFAGVPEGMDAHFSPVVEAARLQTVPEDEMMNYFKSVISDNERLEYGEDRFAEGLAEGLEKGKAEGLAAGLANGLAEGLAKGLSQGKAEVAKAMLADGLSKEAVAKYTGLSEAEIAAL